MSSRSRAHPCCAGTEFLRLPVPVRTLCWHPGSLRGCPRTADWQRVRPLRWRRRAEQQRVSKCPRLNADCFFLASSAAATSQLARHTLPSVAAQLPKFQSLRPKICSVEHDAKRKVNLSCSSQVTPCETVETGCFVTHARCRHWPHPPVLLAEEKAVRRLQLGSVQLGRTLVTDALKRQKLRKMLRGS
jgi:hypothetical protein